MACGRVRTTEDQQIEASILVSGLGMFSVPHTPQIQGLDDFAGPLFHTAQWPANASVRGKRVGVIGTGASAIQIVPALARETAAVSVFQRTPPYVVPRMNKVFTEEEKTRSLSSRVSPEGTAGISTSLMRSARSFAATIRLPSRSPRTPWVTCKRS